MELSTDVWPVLKIKLNFVPFTFVVLNALIKKTIDYSSQKKKRYSNFWLSQKDSVCMYVRGSKFSVSLCIFYILSGAV